MSKFWFAYDLCATTAQVSQLLCFVVELDHRLLGNQAAQKVERKPLRGRKVLRRLLTRDACRPCRERPRWSNRRGDHGKAHYQMHPAAHRGRAHLIRPAGSCKYKP